MRTRSIVTQSMAALAMFATMATAMVSPTAAQTFGKAAPVRGNIHDPPIAARLHSRGKRADQQKRCGDHDVKRGGEMARISKQWFIP